MAMLFAATYPGRTIALVLFGTSAAWKARPDYPFPRRSDDEFERVIDDIDRAWGTRELAIQDLEGWAAPSLATDERAIAWLTNYVRQAASPGAAMALERMNRDIDVRAALPAIHVPTLVLAREGDLEFPLEEERWIADHIRGARLVSFPGEDHFFWVGNQGELLDEVERFVSSISDEEAELDRVLATVLFTDIVNSTKRTAELGDRSWRNWSNDTTPRFAPCWPGTEGRRWTPQETGSSPPSMAQPGRCAALGGSSRLLVRLRSRSVPAYIPVR